ncbi:hypothetical protein [Methanobacterium sp.]|uniref:hypothetical protein n=1 Tax=Methanobacterium sp. TaxID=2164 RepID=UPI003D6496A6
MLIGIRVRIVSFLIFLINLSLLPSIVFARGGRGGGVGEGIVSFGGDSGFQINDPVMFCLYMAFFMVIGIGLAYSYLRVYRVKRRVKALEEREQHLNKSRNLKDTEKHKGHVYDSNKGYLVCEECKGYYMLGKDENPQEFDSCQCGGNLIYYNDLDEFLKDGDFKNENTGN